MKNRLFSLSSSVLLGGALLSVVSLSVHAALPAYDGFEYTNNSALIQTDVTDGNGGSGWNNRWTGGGIATVTTTNTLVTYTASDGSVYGGGNSVSFSGGSTQNAASRTFLSTSDTSGVDVYFSYVFKVTNGTNTGAIASSSFMSVGVLDDSFSIADNFAVVAGSKVGARTNGVQKSLSSVLQYDTTYLVVGRLSGWDGDSYTSTTVWLNPSSDDLNNSSVSATGTDASVGADGFRGITFRTNALDTTGDVFSYDDLRVGNHWDDVVLSTIPEPSSVAALAGLGVLLAAGVNRRRASRR